MEPRKKKILKIIDPQTQNEVKVASPHQEREPNKDAETKVGPTDDTSPSSFDDGLEKVKELLNDLGMGDDVEGLQDEGAFRLPTNNYNPFADDTRHGDHMYEDEDDYYGNQGYELHPAHLPLSNITNCASLPYNARQVDYEMGSPWSKISIIDLQDYLMRKQGC